MGIFLQDGNFGWTPLAGTYSNQAASRAVCLRVEKALFVPRFLTNRPDHPRLCRTWGQTAL